MARSPESMRRRIAKVGTAIGMAWLLIAQPAAVLADDRFSGQIFSTDEQPTGEPVTDYCQRAGIVHTARNYSQILAYTNGGGAHDCAGAVNTLPSGWIGTRSQGFMDGSSCGMSAASYNSSAASNWQLWVTMCANPAGLQEFRARAYGRIYDGSDYVGGNWWGPISPIHEF